MMNKKEFATALKDTLYTMEVEACDKAELRDAIKPVTIKKAEIIMEAFVSTLTAALVKGEEVSIAGIGKFGTKVQPGRTGIIQLGDKKGETWTTEDRTVPTFKAAKALKDAVNVK